MRPGRLTGTVRHAVRRHAAAPARRRGLARLDERGDERSREIAAAIRRHAATDDPEREAWVRRIEDLRGELLAREDTLTVYAHEYSGDHSDERTVTESVGDTCRTASRPPRWSRLLLALVAEVRPAVALELGTCLGISAAYQAAGLRLAGNGGRLVTMDAGAARLELARENLSRLGFDDVELVRGRFQETLAPTLDSLPSVEYAFIDGHHDEHATQEYFGAIAAQAARGAVVVVDDITWSEGMARAWSHIASHDATTLAVDLGDIGICVLNGGGRAENVRIPLS